MAGLYEPRTTNYEPRFFLGLRCGVPPGQTQDGMATVRCSSYILAMHRIHAGSPRASPYPTNRIQAMGMNGSRVMNQKCTAHNKWPHRGCVGASAWEARQRYLTTAQSSIMAGFYESRTTNYEPRFFLGLRCGIPPRQTQDGMATVCHSSYIPIMPRIHAGALPARPYDIAYRR